MVATPNLFFKPVSFFDSPSRRDSGCDTKLPEPDASAPDIAYTLSVD